MSIDWTSADGDGHRIKSNPSLLCKGWQLAKYFIAAHLKKLTIHDGSLYVSEESGEESENLGVFDILVKAAGGRRHKSK